MLYDTVPVDEPARAARGVVRVPAQIAYPVDADGRPLPEPDIYIPGADGRPLEGEALRRRVFGPPEPDDDERPPELGDPPSGFRSE